MILRHRYPQEDAFSEDEPWFTVGCRLQQQDVHTSFSVHEIDVVERKLTR